MSDDKELEIRLQFLEEAREYLETLESRLLGLSQGLDAESVNEALRAAHSIKGGAALMGFQTLSELAHRLEDSLKVLKVQRGKIDTDASLEQQLLAAVDCLAHVMDCSRRRVAVDEAWLTQHMEPIFQALHDRLGDPVEEDARSMLSPEDGQDILPLLFQSEVEGCLERLETVIDHSDPRLREEVLILAQELGGLGEMLQLEAFSQLCEEVATCISASDDAQVPGVAAAALQVWRRTQALVLTGNLSSIPSQFTYGEQAATRSAADTVILEPTSTPVAVPRAVEVSIDAYAVDDEDDDGEVTVPLPQDWSVRTPEPAEEISEPELAVDLDSLDLQTDLLGDLDFDAVAAAFDGVPDGEGSLTAAGDAMDTSSAASTDGPAEAEGTESPSTFSTRVPGNSAPLNAAPPSSSAPEEDSTEEGTVRVPIKQINQLSDLFGELTIERNRLELEVKRLRNLVTTLQGRTRTLDQANHDLRTAYDQVATQSDSQRLRPESSETLEPIDGHSLSHQFDVLEMDRYRDMHLPFREVIETVVQLQEVGADIDLSLDGTEQTTRNLRKTARQLQKNLTQLRMRPLSDVFERFPRALRQMSLQYSKPVELKIQGGRTLVDRNILEALQEPMMHIIRNCFDHGIESADIRRQQGKPAEGTITISAQQQSSRTLITIHDDGGGIPIEKIRQRARHMGLDDGLLSAASDQELLSLIFEPGFSTAQRVTDLSGRGIGMDVVRSKLKDIRGDIQVSTEPGRGTTFTLSIPYTLSVTRVLIAESNGMRLAFPVDTIEEMFVLEPDQVLNSAGRIAFNWDGQVVQLVKLSDWLHFHCPTSMETPEMAPAISTPTVILVQYNNQPVGIEIDRSWGEQEVALRRVAGNLPMPVGFNSCTIMGDGQVVPLVGVPELLYWIASCEASNTDPSAVAQQTSTYLTPGMEGYDGSGFSRKATVLLVDDSINVRRLMALTLEKAGYQVAQAKDGQDAIERLQAGLHADAVLCDVEMPRLDGYGFLAQLKAKAEYEDLPVAMLTSRSGQKHRQLAMSLGASAYFTKPYNEQTLLKTLEDLIQPVMAK